MIRWAAGAGGFQHDARVGQAITLDIGGWGTQACEATAAITVRHAAYRLAIGVRLRDSSLDSEISWTLVPDGSGTRVELLHGGVDLATEARMATVIARGEPAESPEKA